MKEISEKEEERLLDLAQHFLEEAFFALTKTGMTDKQAVQWINDNAT